MCEPLLDPRNSWIQHLLRVWTEYIVKMRSSLWLSLILSFNVEICALRIHVTLPCDTRSSDASLDTLLISFIPRIRLRPSIPLSHAHLPLIRTSTLVALYGSCASDLSADQLSRISENSAPARQTGRLAAPEAAHVTDAFFSFVAGCWRAAAPGRSLATRRAASGGIWGRRPGPRAFGQNMCFVPRAPVPS